ncbi:kinase-like domain-containing protein, partial [Obelidium mucronatum]
RVFKTSFGLRENCIVKERFKKTYRHPVLDEKLSKRRTILEARCLLKARKSGIDSPAVYMVDPAKSLIYMEFIEGETMKAFFNRELNDAARRLGNCEREKKISTKIGASLARLHNAEVVHGDLTTSNMMLRTSSDSVVFIDFGLSFVSNLSEDKAVDLYVLERALASTHPQSHILV